MRFGLLIVLTAFMLGALGVTWAMSRAMHSQSAPVHNASIAHLRNLLPEVNPLIGTLGDGNVFPGADMPFGMVQWSPDTSAGGMTKPGGYNAGDLIIRGFSLTHLSGAGCVSFSNVPFMPTVGAIRTAPQPNGSPYSTRFTHSAERAMPGYYQARLGTGVNVQLTVTPRTGFGRFTYPRGSTPGITIAAGGGSNGRTNIDGSQDASIGITGPRELEGSVTAGHFCTFARNLYTIHFVIQFDRPFATFGTWAGNTLKPGGREARGSGCGAFVRWRRTGNGVVRMKVGISYVSLANARANLQAENSGWNFAGVRSRAQTTWNTLLNRVQIDGGRSDDQRVFYTALYHALLQPNVISDVNGQYGGFDGAVHVAKGYTQYANFSGWDIYRSEIPLLAWLLPGVTSDMMQSLVADAREGGWLPKWPVVAGYTGEMNGDSADPILAGAYAFGARHFDAHTALRAMVKGATVFGAGPQGYEERPGLPSYLRLGYSTQDAGGYGAAAVTLEYVTDDFAIAEFAGALGDGATYRRFMQRSHNWRNLWNSATGFLQPRESDGSFSPAFDATSMSGYVEGNAYQYLWMVPHDLAGLFRLMGGKQVAGRRLDAFFARLNTGPTAPYDWAGNEPALEIPWEYDFAGEPWRTQAVVRGIERTLFTDSYNGLPGNDDLGTMSAWYVWAVLGLYPEIPGVGGFVLGSPLFPRAAIHLQSGTLTITAPQATPGRPYVQSLRFNGRRETRTWIPLQALRGNHTLAFALASRPNKRWGTSSNDAPPSYSR